MKLSVSLPAEDVAFLDSYARAEGIETRSAVLHKAVRMLRASALGAAYEDAWQEWAHSDLAREWDALAGDGLVDEAG
jgi:hypothetical protein